MIQDKKLLKRVNQELLAGNPAWKIIVNKHDWLCPFCGDIGANRLRMEESLELRITQHLRASCPAFHALDATPLDRKTLEKRMTLIEFKRRVARALKRDHVWQLQAAEGAWICPFCARATDLQLGAPYEDLDRDEREERLRADVVGVLKHLLRCDEYADGRGDPRPLEELLEARARVSQARRVERIRQELTAEPGWRFRTMNRRWLCPFCAKTTTIPFHRNREPTPEQTVAVARHLDLCPDFKRRAGKLRSERFLKDRVIAINQGLILERLRRKLSSHTVWQVTDDDDAWVCPYCAALTDVRLPEPRAVGVTDHSLSEVWAHLSTCPDYTGKGAQLHSKGALLQVVAQTDHHKRLRREMRDALLNDPRFSLHDAFGSWLCPYCHKVQKRISVSAEATLLEKTVEQVADHLSQHCPRYREGKAPASTVAELQARIQPERVDQTPDWVQRIGQEVASLKTRVAMSQELEASLEQARSRQLHLMPRLPEVPGFEFGIVYQPCGRIGGDFYDFFQVSASELGVVVGDVAGHGIEAAVLVGLAKKLIQIHGREHASPGQTLLYANADIYPDLDAKTFVTVFLGLLNPVERSLRFARAGHNPLVLFNPHRTPKLQVLDSKGMALGMDAGPIFAKSMEEVEIRLEEEDLLLIYTDGVTEAQNHEREEFGLERLYGVIERYGAEEAEYVLYQIERAVHDFLEGAQQRDDVTLVAIKLLETSP